MKSHQNLSIWYDSAEHSANLRILGATINPTFQWATETTIIWFIALANCNTSCLRQLSYFSIDTFFPIDNLPPPGPSLALRRGLEDMRRQQLRLWLSRYGYMIWRRTEITRTSHIECHGGSYTKLKPIYEFILPKCEIAAFNSSFSHY